MEQFTFGHCVINVPTKNAQAYSVTLTPVLPLTVPPLSYH